MSAHKPFTTVRTNGLSNTQVLCELIGAKPPGTVLSYADLSAALERGTTRKFSRRDVQQAIRAKLNPLFKVHDVVITPALPRTASNKVMRRTLRAEYEQRTKANLNLTHTLSAIATFALVTFLTIVVGELTPKAIALAKPDRWRWASPGRCSA